VTQRQPVGDEGLVQVVGGAVGAEHAGLVCSLGQGDSSCPACVPLCGDLCGVRVGQEVPDDVIAARSSGAGIAAAELTGSRRSVSDEDPERRRDVHVPRHEAAAP
jgi:hypothetical protein